MDGDARRKSWLLGQTVFYTDFEESEQLKYCFMATGFQTQVNSAQAPGVEGDFCNFEPRFTVHAGPGGLVSGPNGCTVGRWAWFNGVFDVNETPTAVSSSFVGSGVLAAGGTQPFGTNAAEPAGFVHREQQALITTFLGDATLSIPQGFPVTLFSGGGFWVKNRGTTSAQIGMKAYANFADGSTYFAASAAPVQGASFTASIIPSLATFTGSITGNVLTVTAVSNGTLVNGMTISGTAGGTISTGQTITSQLTGSTGAVGTYSLAIGEQTYNSATINGSAGILNVTAVASGTLGVGNIITGTGVAIGTQITALGSGTGSTGTYYINPSQSNGSSTDTVVGSIETKFFAMSGGAVGELVKISSHPLG